MNTNCISNYMAKSSLAWDIAGLSEKFFFQPIYTDYAKYAYFDKRSLQIFSTKTVVPN